MGNNNIGIKKCRTILLWVLYFGEVGELPQEFSKTRTRIVFQKIVPNLTVLEGIFEA